MQWRARFRRWLDRWLPPAPEAVVAEAAAVAASPVRVRRRTKVGGDRAVRLALQGGGAHGAFTWGVLDRLLDEPTLTFPHITGASAGALNGAMLVSGWAGGGRAGAQQALAALWDGVGEIGALMAPLHMQQRLSGGMALPGAEMMAAMMRLWSPTQINPLNLNPLRDLLQRIVDVEALRAASGMRLHVAATRVDSGAARVFTGGELSVDVLMASACLPFLYQAVTIDGAAYWDGGYSANPPIAPLLDDDAGDPIEILLVQINPEHRPLVPASASDIVDRVNEITFNASLLTELHAFERLRAAAPEGERPVLSRIALHDEAGDAAASSAASSKGSLDGSVHRTLRDHGRRAAERWLQDDRRGPTPLDPSHNAPMSRAVRPVRA